MAGEHLKLEERKEIEHLLALPVSICKISRIIKRPKQTIVMEVRRNGGKQLYNADKAHERARRVELERKAKLSARRAPRPMSLFSLNQKIDCLKMQMDIIFDELTNLKEKKL